MVPHLRLDLHAKARTLRHADVSILWGDGVFKHQGPVTLIKALTALLYPHIRLRGRKVRRGIEQQRSACSMRRYRQLHPIRWEKPTSELQSPMNSECRLS